MHFEDEWDCTPFSSMTEDDDAFVTQLTPRECRFSSDSDRPDFSSDCDSDGDESCTDMAGVDYLESKITEDDRRDMQNFIKNLDTGEITCLNDTTTNSHAKTKGKKKKKGLLRWFHG
jgi:hypothetical protein